MARWANTAPLLNHPLEVDILAPVFVPSFMASKSFGGFMPYTFVPCNPTAEGGPSLLGQTGYGGGTHCSSVCSIKQQHSAALPVGDFRGEGRYYLHVA